MQKRSFIRGAIGELRKCGAVSVSHEPRNGHGRLWFTFGGERHFITISSTPSDKYAANSLRRTIRRALEGVR